MPYYKVYDAELKQHRLIVADSKTAARNFVANPIIDRRFGIEVAKTADVARLMGEGVKQELVSNPSPPEQPQIEFPADPDKL